MNSSKFARRHRLRSRDDIQQVFSHTERRSRSGPFQALAIMNTLGFSRIALMVPRKRIRTAVCRNRVRRVIRESFRTNSIADTGLDVVVLVVDTRENDYWNSRIMESKLESLWSRLLRDSHGVREE